MVPHLETDTELNDLGCCPLWRSECTLSMAWTGHGIYNVQMLQHCLPPTMPMVEIHVKMEPHVPGSLKDSDRQMPSDNCAARVSMSEK